MSSSSSSYSPNPSSKMLKDFLRDDPPPRDSSMFSSFEAVLAKAFKAVVSRSRRARKFREREAEAKATVVKIKDIVRWTSFRDLVEDVPLGQYGSECFASSVTGSTSSSCTTSSSGGNGSSWCDSDFGEEFLPTWRETTKSFFAKETKMVSSFCVDKEQPESPVSMAGFRFRDDEDAYAKDRSLEDEQSSNDVEDRARHMLNLVTGLANYSTIVFKTHMERLLLDFFMSDDLEREAVDTARQWIEGKLHGANEWGIGGRKDAYIVEMGEAGMWTGFEEGEKMGIVLEAEVDLFDVLMKEVLVDCLAH